MLKFLALANVLQVALLIWKYQILPKQIPLFYSKPWGEGQIADMWYILLLPIFMNLTFFTNRHIAIKFFSQNKFFKSIFMIANGILIVGYTGIFLKILFLIS